MSAATAPEPVERLAYRVKEAAQMCGFSDRTIWRAIKDGRLRATQVGRTWLIPRSALLRFVGESA